jgi:signal transduction histidine kinase
MHRSWEGDPDKDQDTPGSEGGHIGMTPAEQLAHDAATDTSRLDAVTNSVTNDRDLEIERLHARIDQLQRERDAAEGFAALAAHELMSPLVLTEACVALATERLNPSEATELLQALNVLGRGASRTRRLVEALLHEARASTRPIRHDIVDLDVLARDCIDLLGPEIEARSAQIELNPLPHVAGESELLGGLFTNLLMNALKFNPRQGGAVRVAAQRDGELWTIFVDSEGPPIPLEDRDRIFEPYHRGRGERRVRGAGLGLAICRRIVERHGGVIGIAEPVSADADGNRFYFTLPAPA